MPIPLESIPNAPKTGAIQQIRSPESASISNVRAPVGEIGGAFERAARSGSQVPDFSKIKINPDAFGSEYESLKRLGLQVSNAAELIQQTTQRVVQSRDNVSLTEAQMELRESMANLSNSLVGDTDYETWGQRAQDIINGISDKYSGKIITSEARLGFENMMSQASVNYQLKLANDAAKLSFQRDYDSRIANIEFAARNMDYNAVTTGVAGMIQDGHMTEDVGRNFLDQNVKKMQAEQIRAVADYDPEQARDLVEISSFPKEIKRRLFEDIKHIEVGKQDQFFSQMVDKAKLGDLTLESFDNILKEEPDILSPGMKKAVRNIIESQQPDTPDTYAEIHDEITEYIPGMDDQYGTGRREILTAIEASIKNPVWQQELKDYMKAKTEGTDNTILTQMISEVKTLKEFGRAFGKPIDSNKDRGEWELRAGTLQAEAVRRLRQSFKENPKLGTDIKAAKEEVKAIMRQLDKEKLFEPPKKTFKYPFNVDYVPFNWIRSIYSSPTSSVRTGKKNTYYSISTRVGGPDELPDKHYGVKPGYKGTDDGYTSTGKNLSFGVVSVNPRVFPHGTIFKDKNTGEIFIAADSHGNEDPTVKDIYAPPGEYGNYVANDPWDLEVIDKVQSVPSTIKGLQELRKSYGAHRIDMRGPVS